jgi:phosphoribosyl 1,2-cyclic phosphate phosphodiesterase
MEILVLGSGTSHGVPMIGCRCEVCLSADPRNHRFRPSILVRHAGKAILVDTTPELRMQALAFDVRQVDAVLFTHTHADHIMGLDDLRRFNDLSGRDMPVYGDDQTLDDIRRIFPYIFKETQAGGGKPRLTLHAVEPDFKLFGLRIRSFPVLHGSLPVLAYRFDSGEPYPQISQISQMGGGQESARAVAYVTDVSSIPQASLQLMRGLDVLILDAVRFEPHATHFGLYQALEVIAEVQPRQAYLTHLSHHFDHAKVNAQLPDNVRLAHDGLVT